MMKQHPAEALALPTIQHQGNQPALPYDTLALKELAAQRRLDAARVASGALRAFFLNEAERCEQRLQKSLSTPVLRDWDSLRPADQIEKMAVASEVA